MLILFLIIIFSIWLSYEHKESASEQLRRRIEEEELQIRRAEIQRAELKRAEFERQQEELRKAQLDNSSSNHNQN